MITTNQQQQQQHQQQQQQQYGTVQRPDSGRANGSHSSAENSPDHTNNGYFMFDELSSALHDERNNSGGSAGSTVNHQQHHQRSVSFHGHQQATNGSGSSIASSAGSNSSLLSNGDSLMARINQLSHHHQHQQQQHRQQQNSTASSIGTPTNNAEGGPMFQSSTPIGSPSDSSVGVIIAQQQQHQHMLSSVLAQQQQQQQPGSPFASQRFPFEGDTGTSFQTSNSHHYDGGSAQFNSYAQQKSPAQEQQQHHQQQTLTFHQSQQQQQQHHHYHSHHQHHQYTQQKPGFATGTATATTTTTSNGGGDNFHFKTLVPSVAAGAIIGKGGETIASLQKDAGARVKMSKSHDFYPGTTERVCLISGTVDGILTVLDFIIDKIREKPDMTKALTEADAKQAQERDKQVKILVPNSTAGMIIGKAGAYIKQIKEESGSYVQISQKPKELTLQERCITIIGEKENNKVACKMILAKIVEDPSSGTCLNVSYADINGPVANFNPTGSPFAASQTPNFSSSTASLNSAISGPLPSATAAGLLVNGTGLNLSLNLGAPSPQTNPTVTSQLLDHIKGAMRQSGYSDTATAEVHAALGVLAKYGVLGIGVGLQNGTHSTPLGYLGMQDMQQSTAAAAAVASAASSVYGPVGQLNLDSYLHGAGTATPRTTAIDRYDPNSFDPFRHPGTQAATPISLNNNAFSLSNQSALNAAAQSLGSLSKSPTPAEMTTSKEKNVEIPEVIVGAILGNPYLQSTYMPFLQYPMSSVDNVIDHHY
uniref:K Homology domain-containing protein n=1 Tax=Anopheles atroparvus TaxID=41427 RepID=A0AAG5CR27_ANOAO